MPQEISPTYPETLTTSWPLGLAHSITVRPVRPEDIDIETEFVRKLSRRASRRVSQAACFSIGFTAIRNPVASSTAARLRSSGLPDFDSIL